MLLIDIGGRIGFVGTPDIFGAEHIDISEHFCDSSLNAIIIMNIRNIYTLIQ